MRRILLTPVKNDAPGPRSRALDREASFEHNVLIENSFSLVGAGAVHLRANEFIEELRRDTNYRGQISHIERIPVRVPAYGPLERPLPDDIQAALRSEGILRLYVHQTEAINAARRGKNFVVVTSTASGKTLCYNIPVLEALSDDTNARAFYVYPTKALAQDQLGKLKSYPIEPALRAATYDGDTPPHLRGQVRRNSRIILTNPDMLHIAILPYHTTWAHFFRNLKYVVIDEIHTYRGVFGSHVANIIRRLRRIAARYRSNPQFLCASATIANPAEHMRALTGLDEAVVIDRDTSPAGEKYFVFWNPPLIGKDGGRKSSNSEAVFLLTRLVERGVRTIVFAQARKSAELILRYAKQSLREESSPAAEKIMSYRAGYRPEERREIERRLFKGELLGVTSTNALELGVDVGNLDASIITGFPGTIASTWQQAGRAGRRELASLAVLVAQDNPIDQFLMRHPDYFFGRTHERAIIDPENPYLLAGHVLCAAYELPIENEEVAIFGERLYEVLAALGESGGLSYRGRWYWTGGEYPARQVNIRSTSSDSYNIVDVDTLSLLGTVDATNAFDTVHPGAVYLHGGESYVVERLEISERVAYIHQADLPYYTVPSSQTWLAKKEELESKPFGRTRAHVGDVEVTTQVVGYRQKQLFTDAVIKYVPLDLPEVKFPTQSVWFEVPQALADKLIGRGFDLEGTIHAIEHAAIGILPLFAMCDRQDIGGVSHPAHPDVSNLPAIFIYDGHPGGVGISQTAYGRLDEVLEAALKAIEDCACESGCPSCVQSPKCGNNNQPLDKAGAAFLLRELLKSSRKGTGRLNKPMYIPAS
ncbi:MAG: DEAD/DEAH box helicase [Armatimonadetes bacterium]|nr:DEAD/DEAH box helicase [Armatimonadota bacterium]